VTTTSSMGSGITTIESGIDVRRLLYFSVIVEHGSMGRAARALRLSQPALSIAIDKLEKELGATLLVRSSKGVEPTETGEALARVCRGILVSVAAVEREFLRGGVPAPEILRFGCLPTLAGSVIAQAIRHWRAGHPGLELHVTECSQNELLWGLLRRDFDFAIGVVDATNYPHGLRQRVLFREKLHIVARHDHPLAAKCAISPSDLTRYPWVSPTAGWRNTALEHILEPTGLSLQHKVTVCSSITLLTSLLADSDHLALLPAHAVGQEISAGTLTLLDFDQTELQRGIALFNREGSTLDEASAALVGLIERQGRRSG